MVFDPCGNGAHYLRVPEWWLRVPNVQREALMTGAVLLSYWRTHGECRPGMSTIGKKLGLDRRTVIRHIEHLQQVGLVRVHRAALSGPNAERVNSYEFLEHPARHLGSDAAVTTDADATTSASDADVTTDTAVTTGVVTSMVGGSDTGVTQTKSEQISDPREEEGAGVADLEARYRPDLVREVRDACALRRRNGKLADSVWLRTLKCLDAFTVDAVTYAMTQFIDRHADGEKDERYLLGIARRRDAELRRPTGQTASPGKPRRTEPVASADEYEQQHAEAEANGRSFLS